jgi:hypothetical protein
VEDLQVGPADAGDVTPDQNLADAGHGTLQVNVGDLVRPLDEDGLHRPTVTPATSRSAGYRAR